VRPDAKQVVSAFADATGYPFAGILTAHAPHLAHLRCTAIAAMHNRLGMTPNQIADELGMYRIRDNCGGMSRWPIIKSWQWIRGETYQQLADRVMDGMERGPLAESESSQERCERIVMVVCGEMNLPPNGWAEMDRTAHWTYARWIAFTIARDDLCLSYPAIAQEMNHGRSHATIIAAVAKMRKWVESSARPIRPGMRRPHCPIDHLPAGEALERCRSNPFLSFGSKASRKDNRGLGHFVSAVAYASTAPHVNGEPESHGPHEGLVTFPARSRWKVSS